MTTGLLDTSVVIDWHDPEVVAPLPGKKRSRGPCPLFRSPRRHTSRADPLQKPKAAVAQVIGFSRQRVEADRWVAFRSRFDIDAFYCQPGIAGAHEKGGVEGGIGRFRRNHLVPVPSLSFVKPTPTGDGLVMITVLVSVMNVLPMAAIY
jgi:hypothetical protein